MSWADIVKKKADPTVAVPKQVLIPDGDNAPSKVRFEDTTASRVLPPEGVKEGERVIILDTGAIVSAHDVGAMGDKFYTIEDVLAEVRDGRSRHKLENLTFELDVVVPSNSAIREVIDATTKTGDIGSLSRTDIRVLALAYQVASEAGCISKVGEQVTSKVDAEESDDDDEDADNQKEAVIGDVSDEELEEGEEEESDEDDGNDDDWITPENIHVHKAQPNMQRVGDLNDAPVSCLTVDFAMQNALLHMGIPVLGVDGRRITRLRTWVLRCHACFTIWQDTTKQFCSSCGSGDTLRKVSYTIDADGNREVWINWNRRLNTRGVRYNLPKPRWGARGTNRTLVLREDQLKDFGRTKSQRQKDLERQRYFTSKTGGEGDAFGKSRAKQSSHAPREKSSYHKFNLNERRKLRAARKK